MGTQFTRKLITENGREFYGFGFGAFNEEVCELVFNTEVVGYQEIITDPTYAGQGVVMTYPLIGSYGITDEDNESRAVMANALIVREYNDLPSNFRYTRTLSETLAEYGVVGIDGVDTRELTRMLREEGTMYGIITYPETSVEQGLEAMRYVRRIKDLVKAVSCKKRWYSRTTDFKYNVVVLDCGVKHSIIRKLNSIGCNLTIVPYNTTADEIIALCPDGLVISNGPGNPDDAPEVIETIKSLKGKIPIMGICLGNLAICRAYGAEIYKMKPGHRGGNHPVKDLESGKLITASQVHDYAAVPESLESAGLKITHINVIDGTVEGVENADDMIFGVQFRPEGGPGPQDGDYVYEKFVKMMEKGGKQ